MAGELKWQGFIHIIQSRSQGSSAVVAIMHHVLATLKSEHPEVNKAYFSQDNAGCYHSSSTILVCPEISASTGIQVSRVDFSDPQGGKGAADRLAARCKAHVRAFINEGHDVCTANELKNALLSYGGLDGVRVVSLDAIDETPDESQTITVEPRFNEVSRDWGNWFVISRVRYIEVHFHTLHYYWAEKYRSLYRGLRYIEVR